MLKNLDIGLVRTFVMVAEKQNMTLAADKLNLTQGAVSQQIRRLEESLAFSLFDRHRRTLKLSGPGVEFLKRANELLELNDAIIDETVTHAVQGIVRFGVPFDLVVDYLPIVLDGFSDAYPDVEISLFCETSGKLIEMVADGELDLAIAEEGVDAAKGECLCTQRLVWIGQTKVLKQKPLPISIGSKTCVFRPAIQTALEDAGVVWRAVFENGNLEATMTTVRAGFAIGTSLLDSVPQNIAILPHDEGLPALPSFSICLHTGNNGKDAAVSRLADNVRGAFLIGKKPVALATG